MKGGKNFVKGVVLSAIFLWITSITYAKGISNNTLITVITDGNSPSLLISKDYGQVELTEGENGQAVFVCDYAQWLNQTGEPQTPWKVLTVLLPPDVNLASVSVCMKDTAFERIENTWVVAPAPPMMTRDGDKPIILWPKDRNIDQSGRDVDIYEHDALWPKADARMLATGRLRCYRLAQVAVPLARYNPVRGQLELLTEADVAINFERTSLTKFGVATVNISDEIGEEAVQQIVVNFEQGRRAYDMTGTGVDALDGGESNRGYAIVTTSAIESASTKLDDFVAHKESLGFDVQVVTESNFGGGTGDAGAENVRLWLQNHYMTDNIEYVLLIGDPHPDNGNVPMKMIWPRHGEPDYPDYEEAPSDFYYADLTGNWDLDGDGYYGEWTDDFGIGGVDLYWDVLVGRIPYYGSIDEMDAILQKTINYESQTGSAQWRKNVLLPMADDYYLGEAIKDNFLVPHGWSYHRVYNEDYGLVPCPETIPCTYDNVTTVWNGDAHNSDGRFGLVVWWTHGKETYATDIMDVSHVPDLDDAYPSFTFQASCRNAHPETSNNLTYELLKNGGICTVGATRVSWGFDGQSQFSGSTLSAGIGYEYAMKVVDGLTGSQALYGLKQSLWPNSSKRWMNFTIFNIYGDPALAIVPRSGPVRFVDANASTGGDGLSWETAYNDLQDALSSGSRTEVRVAQGIYKPDRGTGDRTATFQLINGVTIRGGYAGFGEPDPNACDPNMYETLLSGELNANDTQGRDPCDLFNDRNRSEKSYHVVTGRNTDQRAILQGFTIIGGNADGSNPHDRGGGMYNSDGNPMVNKCIFTGNTAIYGAGVFNYNSSPMLTNCTFSGSSADCGGGMYNQDYSNPALSKCTFSGNSAGNGGGMHNYNSSAMLTNCTFSDNSADCGGGMYNQDYSNPALSKCTFSGNSASYYAGGIYNYKGSDPNIIGCTFSGNSAYCGGGMRNYNSSPMLTNCTFSSNSADCGGGMYNYNSSLTVTNCILWGNTASSGGNGIATYSSTIDVDYCNVQGGQTGIHDDGSGNTINWGTGNMDADPVFVDPDSNDLHLLPGSPCIDAGDPSYTPGANAVDMDGEPRVMDGNGDGNEIVDMGAYEGAYERPCECLGDLGEPFGQVDLQDLDALVNMLVAAGPPFIVPVGPGHCGDMAAPMLQVDLQDLDAMVNLLVNAGPPFIVPCE